MVLPVAANEEIIERKWLSHCRKQIARHYVEPSCVRKDKGYFRMRVQLSFFLSGNGSIACLELDRNENVLYRNAEKQILVKPAFVKLCNKHCMNKVELAVSDAVRRSQPLPTEGFRCPGPYFMTVSYTPGEIERWQLVDCPPPCEEEMHFRSTRRGSQKITKQKPVILLPGDCSLLKH